MIYIIAFVAGFVVAFCVMADADGRGRLKVNELQRKLERYEKIFKLTRMNKNADVIKAIFGQDCENIEVPSMKKKTDEEIERL